METPTLPIRLGAGGLVPSCRYSVWVPVSPLCRFAVLRLPVRQSILVWEPSGTAHRRLSGTLLAGHDPDAPVTMIQCVCMSYPI